MLWRLVGLWRCQDALCTMQIALRDQLWCESHCFGEDLGFGVSQSLCNELEECDWCKVYFFIKIKEPLLQIRCLLATIQKYVSSFSPEAACTEWPTILRLSGHGDGVLTGQLKQWMLWELSIIQAALHCEYGTESLLGNYFYKAPEA